MRERGHTRRRRTRMLASILLAAVMVCAGGENDATAADTPRKPTVYLTFDDGPSPVTDRVLAILREEEVKATFFVVGAQAEKYPERLRQIAEQGHAIGNHSYNHKYEEIYGGFKSFAAQIVRTNQILKKKANVTTRLVRAPGGTFGNFDSVYFNALQAAGYIVFDWHVDSGDTKKLNVPAQEIAANVLNAKLLPEMIVLLHDGTSHKETAAALPQIIKHFKKHGYQFAILTDKVKPHTFRLAPTLKWKRAKPSSEQAVAWLGGKNAALPNQAAGTQPEPPAEPTAQPKPEPPAEPTAQPKPEPPAEPDTAATPTYITLREWVTDTGGSVSWDPIQGMVFAFVQGSELHFIPQSTQVEVIDPDGAAHTLNIQLSWQKGVLKLPADALGQLLTPSAK